MIYSKYARNKLIDAALRGGSITFPSTYYLALLTSKPTTADVYTEIGNTIQNGYTRVAIPANASNWSSTVGSLDTSTTSTGELSTSNNINAINFPNPSGGNWFHGAGPDASTIKYIGLFDSGTIGSGNLWFFSPLGSEKSILSTDFNISIAPTGLKFNFDK